ncbi:MAG: SIS domain-containing protein [Pseudomonadota bacterium]
MSDLHSKMYREVREIPEAVDRLLNAGGGAIQSAAAALRERDPAFLVSVARGSSDHVATYFKYASELLLGLPVASVGPSVASVYKRPLKLGQGACIAISQSGQSPDIVEMMRMAQASGAPTVAITNDATSRLAAVSDHTLELHAGPELSVAATKTFVTSAVCALWLLAEWAEDHALLTALHRLPEALQHAVALDWSAVGGAVRDDASLYCLGRGPSYAMSNEAALKFKEVCQIHAESYSSAEVLHGPVSIVGEAFPVLALTGQDAAEPVLTQVADKIAGKGASVFVTSDTARVAHALPAVRTGHPLTDPITLIASFYTLVEGLAVARGMDPDAPRHLNKVTETV